MNKKRYKKSNKKKESGGFGLLIFEFIGWIVLAGALLVIWETSRMITIIVDANPVTQLSADTTGIVRLEGPAVSRAEVTDQGTLRNTYALLQKEPFRWECSRGGCDYEPDDSVMPDVLGNIRVHDIDVGSERYRFYTNWLPLDAGTVEQERYSRIYEGGSSRPLLVEKQKSTAYGYRAVSSGQWITVIGHAKDGHLEPFTLPGSDDDGKPVILIGDNIERMVSKEKEIRTGFVIVGFLVMLLLLPRTIGRIRRIYGRIETKRIRNRTKR